MSSGALYWTTLLSSFSFALIGQIVLLRFWRFSVGVDAGDGVRKLQKGRVLRIGGLPIYLGFVSAYFFAAYASNGLEVSLISVSFLILGSLVFLLGFCDDLFQIHASVKLLAQIAVGVAAYECGMRIELITAPFGVGSVSLGGFSLLVTIFWFVALPNLINLIDGLDGLAGGIGLFLSLTLGVLGVISGNVVLATISFGLAGALIAFLAFNLPPAKIYMGDGGAYLIGFFIAGASLMSSNKASIFVALLVVFIALGFPILDTLLAIVRRALTGLPIMQPDARHLHHRLMTLGFSKRTIIFFLYGAFATLSLLGLSVFLTKGYSLPVVGMTLVLAVFLVLRILKLPHTIAEAKLVFREMVAGRKDVRYAYTLAQVLEHDVERMHDFEDYWQGVALALNKVGIRPLGEYDSCEGCCDFAFAISEREEWRVSCCSPREQRQAQWERTMRCFLPALAKGRAKWGDPPAEFNITNVNPPKAIDSTGDASTFPNSLGVEQVSAENG